MQTYKIVDVLQYPLRTLGVQHLKVVCQIRQYTPLRQSSRCLGTGDMLLLFVFFYTKRQEIGNILSVSVCHILSPDQP